MAADLEFYFDPVCPWAWITSRWVTNVQQLRNYEVSWRFISLKMINAERGYAGNNAYELIHNAGLAGLRVASAARAQGGNASVAALYAALGNAIHVGGRREELVNNPHAFLLSVVADAGLPAEIASAFEDSTHDEVIRYETEAALSRTGKDVGTPILTFNPKAANEASLFGPVISKAPKGDEAVKLWDAVQTIAESGVAEIKRSLRAAPQFD
jgi:protein-disulfide isomerase-like protein with CxxC motif